MRRTLPIAGFVPGGEVPRTASKITISVTVNLGVENGKPLGTVLQLQRASGQLAVAGALGAPQFFNHYVRNNTRMLHVHGRKADESAFTVEELGTPRSDNPRYHVFVFDGVLIDGTNREFFNEGSSAWQALSNPWNGATFSAGEQINYAVRVEGQVFISTDKGVFYNGTRIVSYAGPTYKSSNGSILYYDGLLFTNWDDGVLRTYAWTPGAAVGAPINSFDLISGHFLRAFGVVGGLVYAVSGYGRLLRYDRLGNSWSYVTQAESVNEFYSAMVVNGTLRLGDYPNGNQWLLNGSSLERLASTPPVESGAGSSSREIQAMTMYGGDQVLPLFPWGYVHRQHMANGDWFNQRLYSAPAVNTSDGPYVNEFGNGDWRQRIPSAGLYGDGAFFAGSNTPGDLMATNHASVPNKAEYGKVWLLRRPHAFSAELDWKAGETVFTYEISAVGGLRLLQDGVLLGSVSGFAPSQFEGSDPITLQLGDGIYGPFGGTIVGHQLTIEY